MFTTTPGKLADAKRPGAIDAVLWTDGAAMRRVAGQFDILIATIPQTEPIFSLPSPEPEHRRRQANLPRSVRQPDQVDTRQYREKPPAARYFHGTVDATDAFIPSMDADGHFAGGVRLPHVASTVHGRVAGAPLGRYAPLNPAGLDPFVFLGGTFTRFGDDELLNRYASRRQVRMARRARGEPSGRQELHLQQRQESAHRCGRRRAAAVSSRG